VETGRRKKSSIWLVAALTIVCWTANSGAANGAERKFSTKFIEVVVPFAAGGAVDNTIRLLGNEVEKTLGQKIMILNKPAGGSVEGQRYVAQAKPDGHTLLAMTSSVVTNILTKQVDFTLDSYEPVMMYSFDPMVFVVYGASPYKTLADVVAASKQKPLNASTPGKSNSKHVAGMILEQKTGARFTYVHTKGAAEGVPMIAGGHVQCGCWSWGEVKPLVEQGKIRPLAVMAEQRDADFSKVPTFAELGFNITYGAWRGISAPKGVSPEVKAILLNAFSKAIQTPDVVKKFDNAGFPVLYKDSEGFRKYVQEDYDYVKAILGTMKK
jgi:tripartite-type tricarboxylate transporter receptor subunit TctC